MLLRQDLNEVLALGILLNFCATTPAVIRYNFRWLRSDSIAGAAMSHRYDLILEDVEVTIFRAHKPLLSTRDLLPARSGKIVVAQRSIVARQPDRSARTITMWIFVLLAVVVVLRLSLKLLHMWRELRGWAHCLILFDHLIVQVQLRELLLIENWVLDARLALCV